MLGEAAVETGSPSRGSAADDEAELELDVEPARGAEGRRVGVGRLGLAARAPTGVPLTTTVPARPW